VTLTIDATPGSATANSFVTEAEAIAFAATRLNLTGWGAISGVVCSESEKQALIEATRELSALAYPGYRTDPAQALAWPRQLVPNPDTGSSYYTLYDSAVVPARLKDATCELAIAFLAADTTDIAALDASQAVIRKNIGGAIDTTYAAPSQRAQGLNRFPRVMRHLAPLLAAGSGQVRLTR
jgi:hypothetical protein